MASVRDVAPYPKLLDHMEKMLSLLQAHSAVETCRLVVERTIIRTPSRPEQTNVYDTAILC